MTNIELRGSVTGQDGELEKAVREHRELDLRVEALAKHRSLTSLESLELRRLKKQKLAGRDRIEAILAAHRRSGSSAVGT
jgi:hypothetical protein